MARPSKAAAHYRAKIGAISTSINAGYRPIGDPELAEVRRALAAELLAERVERIVRELGPLTDEQCERITALLRTSMTP